MRFSRIIMLAAATMLFTTACANPPEIDPAPPDAAGEVVYPILAPKYAFATERHTGESRYGTTGAIGDPVIKPVFASNGSGSLKVSYSFDDLGELHEIAGVYFSFGRTALDLVNPDGTDGGDLILQRDGAVNVNAFMQTADVSMEQFRVRLGKVKSDATLTVRFEVTDGDGTKAGFREEIESNETYTVDFSSLTGIDRTAIKLIALVIEEAHDADGIVNPKQASFVLKDVALLDTDGVPSDAAAIAALNDRTMLLEIGRRDFESLMRLRDAKTGAALDRTLFRDLIHWGSTGPVLASLPQAVKLGWIKKKDAIEIVLRVLRFVDDDALWSDAPTGMLGNSVGIMYRYGGIDPAGLDGPLTGTRKIDLGNVNAVEASVIDTALFQFGLAVCATAFGDDEPEILTRVQSILSRTDWDSLVEPNSGQLYLSWKPASETDKYEAPAAFGGFWASNDDDEPLTIDYWTDEGAMAAVLAAGSNPDLASTWYAMLREEKDGAIVTWPGAWFTYTFFTSTYLPKSYGADNAAQWQATPVDWRANARTIYKRYESLLGDGHLPDAVELPNNAYIAQGLLACSVDPGDHYYGVQTPYSFELALGLGGTVAKRATDALRRMLQETPELWDPFYGFLDSYHADLASFSPPDGMPHAAPLVRNEGQWIQQQVWTLNKATGLLALLNYVQDGAIAKTAQKYPQIEAGLTAVYGPDK